jgi:undecaprenyl-diphosphatase
MVLAAALLVVTVGLAVRVHSLVGPLRVDRWASRHIETRLPGGSSAHVGLAGYNLIARTGAPAFVAITMLVAVVWAVHRRDTQAGVLAVVAPVVALVVAELLAKPIVGRQDPNGMWSFPSGTVTAVAAAAAVAVVLVYRWAGAPSAIVAALTLGVVPVVMSVAVVELRWHYATDVVAGLALGTAVVLVTAASLAAFEGSRVRPRPIAS